MSEDDDENSERKSAGVESKNGNSAEKEEGELEDGELEDDSDGEVKSDERPSQDRIPITVGLFAFLNFTYFVENMLVFSPESLVPTTLPRRKSRLRW